MLEPAFPSSPTLPPKWGIRIHGRRQQTWHFAFVGTYAARHFLDQILDTTDHKWVSHEEIELAEPAYTITCEQPDGLDAIMSHKLTAQEEAYTLPTPYPQQIAQLLRRSYFAAGRPDAPSPELPSAKPAKRSQRRSSSEKPAKSANLDGLIALDAITGDPKKARNALRAANFPKPASGKWLFTAEEAEAAKKVLARAK